MSFSELLREVDPERSLPFENRLYANICGSTNEIGKRIGAAGARELENENSEAFLWRSTHPWLIVALEQAEGRGRLGNRWQSPRGGIYVSIVVPAFPTRHVHNLPQLAGVGLCKGVEAVSGRRCTLKWPNDLQIGAKKVGGILIEVVARNSEIGYAVIGFGVNFLSAPRDIPYPTTAIAEEARSELQYSVALRTLVSALCQELDRCNDSGYAMRSYASCSAHRVGETMTCRMMNGSVTGTFLGFDTRGFLRLQVEGSEQVLAATEIVPAAPELT